MVVGVVETHGRRETEALIARAGGAAPQAHRVPGPHAAGVRPRRGPGPAARAAAGRRIAHSNAPGSRHPKRWQDVDELLAAGINVWTTLNVQHLESLVDVVWKITGVRERETVPDGVLSKADEIEVVDITPAELRQRLDEGKVYVPETARLAVAELLQAGEPDGAAGAGPAPRRPGRGRRDGGAMRRAGVAGPWAAGERILVLIGGDTMADPLVRTGRRLAEMMDAPWTVAHVERAGTAATQRRWPRRGSATRMKLAEQLGGATLSLTADDLVAAVAEYCENNNVTQLVIGKSRDSRWREVLGRSFAAAMMRRAQGAALHVVTEGAPAHDGPKPRRRLAVAPGAWRNYLPGVGYVAAATVVAWYVYHAFHAADLGMIYLAAVLAAAFLQGLRPALLSAVLAFGLYNFLFLEPRYSFVIGSPTDSSPSPYSWPLRWSRASSPGACATSRWRRRGGRRPSPACWWPAVACPRRPRRTTRPSPWPSSWPPPPAERRSSCCPPAARSFPLRLRRPWKRFATQDMAAARWAWEHGEAAGAGTGTLPNAAWTFRPLQGVSARAGVAATDGDSAGDAEGERFVISLLDQGAIALERAELAAEASEAEALRRSERLRAALLNSISHDLRTPLAGVWARPRP